jgi:hypothetical protein
VRPAIIALLLLASPAAAGEADRHDFRDAREALVRQLSPEGRYCRECHARKPIRRAGEVRPLPPVPLASTALLFGTALGGLVIIRKLNRRT